MHNFDCRKFFHEIQVKTSKTEICPNVFARDVAALCTNALFSPNCNFSYVFAIFNDIAKSREFLIILVSESLFSIFTFFVIQGYYY